MNNIDFEKLLETAPQNQTIFKYLLATRQKLSEYRKIAVSYSGGSDSDIILDLIELVKPDDRGEIRYVFFDTGLEWDATLRHVSETEKRYGVEIERRRAKVPIPLACKKYGIPFISKDVSGKICTLQRHDFDFTDSYDCATVKKYGNCKHAIDWYFDKRGLSKSGKKLVSIAEQQLLKEFITANPPDFSISKKCCDYVKKNTSNDFNRDFRPDICVNGMRQGEGGLRVSSIKSCFSPSTYKKSYAEYRPLWFWKDADKQQYKEWRKIRYSDCYEVWSFKRTGCVGCPCSVNSIPQLEIARLYEPKKVKAAYKVFGKTYEYRAKYNEFKRIYSCKYRQLSVFEV